MTVDVAIVGAGVSGLAAAYELRCRGRSVVVLERQVHVGGNTVSERIGDFLMEHGPSSVSAASTTAAALSREMALEDQRVELGPGVRRRYLTANGRLHGISTHPFGFLLSDYLSWRGRVRMAAEIGIPRGLGNKDESVAEFCHRRFGAEFASRVMDPLVGGMFAGDASRLAMTGVFPTLAEMERSEGSIIRELIRRRLRGQKMPARRLFAWREGIGVLPRRLAMRLAPLVRTGVAVRRITRVETGFRVEAGAHGAIDASAVVIATQPHVAAQLLEKVSPGAGGAAAAIEAPPLAVVFLGYRRRQVTHPLDGLGYLTASAERRDLTGALFCSTMFAGRAPQGHVALAGYFGGARAPHLAKLCPEDLVDLARAEFSDLLGAGGEPVVARVRQWPRGVPQYNVGHHSLVAALKATSEEVPGLYVTGNYFRGVSVAACLEQAVETATRIDRYLPALGQSAMPILGNQAVVA